MTSDIFNKYHELYLEAVGARTTIDSKIKRRYDIYYGDKQTLDFSNPNRKYSKKDTLPLRKMCFELIEAQVDVSIPLAKVTPRYAEDAAIAAELEEFLNLQADALNSEDINDIAEREVRIQGTGIYHIDWDETVGNPRRQGDLVLSFIRLSDFYPQPNIDNPEDLEYVFIHTTTTIRRVKELYGVTVEPDKGTKTSVDLVVCWYLNDEGAVSKLIWTKQGLVEVYYMNNYYARKQRLCSVCGEVWDSQKKKCVHCGSPKWKYIDNSEFPLPEDLYVADTADPTQPPRVYMRKDTPIDNYRIKKLPFVVRHNIAAAGGGLYGVSDVDLLEEAQDANNKILNKIAENIMNGGTVVTLPSNATIDNAAGSLKKIRLQDPRQKQLVDVFSIQANVQQDDIAQDRLYQIGRQGVGITDAYQGKRDPTAESGKAKEISAMQTAGRLESKYVDKTTAYSKIYRKMFEFLLAFSDEKRRIVRPYSGLNVEEAVFSKYSFIVPYKDRGFLNDDFIFSTNGSYILSNRKESLWQAATQTFMSGGFGNPADPRVVLIYWNLLNRYDYPLAGKVLALLNGAAQRLPPELEQALLQNPELIDQLMMLLDAKNRIAKNKQEVGAQQAQEILDPTSQDLITSDTVDDTKPVKKEGGKA